MPPSPGMQVGLIRGRSAGMVWDQMRSLMKRVCLMLLVAMRGRRLLRTSIPRRTQQ